MTSGGTWRSRATTTIAALALIGPLALAAPTAAAAVEETPIEAASADGAQRYIVQVEPGAVDEAIAALPASAEVVHEYSAALNGFAVEFPAGRIHALSQGPGVVSVTADTRLSVDNDTDLSASKTQGSAPWGLDRIDQRANRLDGSYTYTGNGSGVNVFVIDTGVRASHGDFGGRVRGGWDFVDGDSNARTDCNGHGTHVAGTVAGQTFGVAKKAVIVPVRILDCNGDGWGSDAIAAVDWVIANRGSAPAVINFSVGGPANSIVDKVFAKAASRGITSVVAAGNESQNACNVSPARAAQVIAVGASTKTDQAAWFSNYGSCVDIFAPGEGIRSAVSNSNSGSVVMDGTSMAAPHVAGAAARYLSTNRSASPSQVSSALRSQATSVSFGAGSPSRLLFAPGAVPAATPTISGTPRAGVKLTAVPGKWEPGAKLSYQWRAGGVAISGATASTFSPTAAQVGRKLTVTVTGRKVGFEPASRTSASTAAVKPGPAAVPTKVTATRGTKAITISWQPPAKTGGAPVSAYALTLTSAEGSKQSVRVSKGSRSYTWGGLVAGRKYTLSVAAVTSAGTGAIARVSAWPK